MRLSFIVSAVVAVIAVSGCARPAATVTGCTVDSECGVSQRCDTLSGQCLCTDDNGCDPSEFCNVVGKCQLALNCLDNTDCEATEFCDTTTGECIARVGGLCVLDSQCPFGSYCGQNRGCATGCRDDGDCNLGTPCIDGQCDSTPGACTSQSFCEFGQVCGANNRCVDHAQRSQLCQDCSGSAGAFTCLDDCLIDSSVEPTICTNDSQCDRGSCEPARCADDSDCPGGGRCTVFFGSGTCSTSICQGAFCGASGCSETNPCPRGYSCGTLQVVSGTQCTLGSNTCGANRACNGGGENGNVGFCSCASDADCPQSGFDAPTTCQNPGPNGACIIGTTCAPADGLLCEDLR